MRETDPWARTDPRRDGEHVWMASRTGAAEVPVSFAKDVLPGTVYLSHGDEFTGLPSYNGIPCRVEKIKAKAPRVKKKAAVNKRTGKKPARKEGRLR